MNYILAIDDNPGILDLYQLTLSRFFPHEFLAATSTAQAKEIIKDKGTPELIICDDKMPGGNGDLLINWMKEQKLEVPFIICSSTPEEKLKVEYPEAYGFIQKPKVREPLVEMVGDILAGQKSLLSYIPISVSLLLKIGKIECDLYMKLSYAKYVKVLREGETFINVDAERFYQKQIHHLYVTAPDAERFIEEFEKNLEMVLASQAITPDESRTLALESLEVVERMAFCLGWTPQVMESAKKSIGLAIRTISEEPKLLKLMNQKFKSGSAYSRHVSLIAMVSCCLSQQLGWTSESSQMKLAIAALLHDIAVDDEVYLNVHHWNSCARNYKLKDPDTLQYRNHPVEAVTMLRNLKNLPPDIDHIILQHHELEDGSGFPYKLTGARIAPMTSVFILAEDIVTSLKEDEIESSLMEFLKNRESSYSTGNFKKVFSALKDNIKEVV